MTLTRKDIIRMGGNTLYFLFILLLMLDPTNMVLHLKEVVMVLLVGYNALFYKPVLTYVPQLTAAVAAIAVSYCVAEMRCEPIDYEYAAGVLKSVAMLLLLLWSPYYDLFLLLRRASIVFALVIVVIYIAVCSSPIIEQGVFFYVKAHGDMMMMSQRHFLGLTVYGIYFKSLITLAFPLYLFSDKLFNTRGLRRIGALTGVILLSASFLMSGSRSPMLLPFALIGIAFYLRIKGTRRAKYFIYPAIALIALLFVGLILVLAGEKGESSNVAKYGHLVSYGELFFLHPDYLLWGQGLGTLFYTVGFGQMTVLTEWSYLELLRHFGIFAILFLWLYLYPVGALWKNRGHNICLGIFIAYIAYLFIAGTNPLIISSTGMLVVLAVYSFISKTQTAPDRVH